MPTRAYWHKSLYKNPYDRGGGGLKNLLIRVIMTMHFAEALLYRQSQADKSLY